MASSSVDLILRDSTWLASSHVRLGLRGPRLLAVLYLLVALPVACFLSWHTPPFQTADEDSHFLRALQVAHGGLMSARMRSGRIGGMLPAGADRLAHGYLDLRFHAHVDVPARRYERDALVQPGAPAEVSFANTAIYPPIFYLPAAAGILAGEATGNGVLAELRLARLANAFCATLMAASAIAITVSGALPLFWLLCLPMTVSLFASCSQDALVIASSALVAASISRLAYRRHADPGAWIAVSAGLGCIAAAKLPYLLLAPLPLLWAGVGRLRGSGFSWLLLPLLPLAIGLGWLFLGVRAVIAPNDAGRQIGWLLAHPLRIPGIVVETLHVEAARLGLEFIGVLGWLDVPLSPVFYGVSVFVIGALLGQERPGRQRPYVLSATLMVIALCGIGILGTLYLNWTRVGAATVDGLQGRYFIPLACFGILLLQPKAIAPRGSTVVCVGWALLAALVTISAIRHHYTPGW
jgi:hypothetical protein